MNTASRSHTSVIGELLFLVFHHYECFDRLLEYTDLFLVYVLFSWYIQNNDISGIWII